MPIFSAFARALTDVTQPRVLAVLFLPMFSAVLLWSVLAWMFWEPWTQALRGFFDGTWAANWLVQHGASWVLESLTAVLVVALLLPLILITAVIVTELVAMPMIVSLVARDYPQLAKRSGGSTLGSVSNAVRAVMIFILLWIGTLPLWLTGVGAVILPALNSAYLNQRLFRYDALAEHASREEYEDLVRRAKGRLYLLGLLLAGLYYIPFVNLVAPVFSGLAFTHFCLAELKIYRESSRRIE
jgi:CysZ protein